MRRIGQSRRLRSAQFLYWEWRHFWLCKDLLINLGASAKECRNKRLHLLNVCVAEFKDVVWHNTTILSDVVTVISPINRGCYVDYGFRNQAVNCSGKSLKGHL